MSTFKTRDLAMRSRQFIEGQFRKINIKQQNQEENK